MTWIRKSLIQLLSELTSSILYNETTFYKQFIKDLLNAKEEVIIASPFIARYRLEILKPTLELLEARRIHIFILTRDPSEHTKGLANQAEEGIRYFERLGPQVLITTGRKHQKVAIIDRKVLWKGSLNILSQAYSGEVMERIENRQETERWFNFLRFNTIDDFNKKLNLV